MDVQPSQVVESLKEADVPTRYVPLPEGTWTAPLPGITPTVPEPTITPTPAILQPAVFISPSRITTVTQDLSVRVEIQNTIDSEEPWADMAWGPTGEKLLYVTASGKLYYSNLDGSDALLLHTYSDYYPRFDEQLPLGNVLFVNHVGHEVDGKRLPSHVDVIKFAPGQPPTVEEDHEVPYLWSVHWYWWRPDRASAVLGLHYWDNAYYWGGDRLVTLDTNGHIVEERNIPYMVSSAVSPGGEWLAYATDQQSTSVPMQNAEAATTYLLNMRTGQRLQLTPPGEGRWVGAWSPDGNWFMGGRGLISADGSESIVVPWGLGGDAVWSPDSRYLAFSRQGGGCEPEGCTPYVSDLYVVDVRERKMAIVGEGSFSPRPAGMVMRPRWSPDGSQLALLSYKEGCFDCSGTNPALYFATLRQP
jgi:hypothetical protein